MICSRPQHGQSGHTADALERKLTCGFGFLNYNGIAWTSVNSPLPTAGTGQLLARFEF